jgi:hypothetical protein
MIVPAGQNKKGRGHGWVLSPFASRKLSGLLVAPGGGLLELKSGHLGSDLEEGLHVRTAHRKRLKIG